MVNQIEDYKIARANLQRDEAIKVNMLSAKLEDTAKLLMDYINSLISESNEVDEKTLTEKEYIL